MQNQIEKEEKKGSRTISEREGGRPGRGGAIIVKLPGMREIRG